EEDLTFVLKTDEDAYQTIVSGIGELHLDVIARRIKDDFGIDIHVGKPQVVYKETIEKQVHIEHSFEKTINNINYKGYVSIDVSPGIRGEGIKITSQISEEHPAYPYLQAIEEGILEASNIGVLKGFPITDIEVLVKDASFSSPEFARLTLKMAAYEAFRKGCVDASPVLLVPIMSLTVTTPNEFLGDIISDLNARKCQILSIITKEKITVLNAHAPLTNMFGYSTDVRSLSQGRASFTMFFSHYDRIENG
ncbi:MAG TPA: hypothetical protein PLM71_04235, partial [Syntrophorhabdaceae bacterium]|nr:hypothetical protein [Syntrophorhabdaceae bacterium]